jgi:hypothetical protein
MPLDHRRPRWRDAMHDDAGDIRSKGCFAEQECPGEQAGDDRQWRQGQSRWA